MKYVHFFLRKSVFIDNFLKKKLNQSYKDTTLYTRVVESNTSLSNWSHIDNVNTYSFPSICRRESDLS